MVKVLVYEHTNLVCCCLARESSSFSARDPPTVTTIAHRWMEHFYKQENTTLDLEAVLRDALSRFGILKGMIVHHGFSEVRGTSEQETPVRWHELKQWADLPGSYMEEQLWNTRASGMAFAEGKSFDLPELIGRLLTTIEFFKGLKELDVQKI
ncbi:hypothetical protein EK21DRAFT_108490 [Setomelanomma holmii]|uniref:Uncharacterized protein n=1 Tax=Setomelanomma holmii TaxID=210430 RepID=A0A9P4LR89_9PLEO|nr:hypothetical protein EK21DRAFT_108490 [Setomelanomma holmii]